MRVETVYFGTDCTSPGCRKGADENYITSRDIYYHNNSHVCYKMILEILS
jgi:hypothetical protein